MKAIIQQIQELQWTPRTRNMKKMTPTLIIVKIFQIREKLLKASKKNTWYAEEQRHVAWRTKKYMWHGSILCKIPENANYCMVTESRTVVASGLGESRRAAGRDITEGSLWGWQICLLSWLQLWLHICICHVQELIELYTLNKCTL